MEQDIVIPINEELRREQELRKARKRVTTARVLVYVLVGMLLLSILTTRNFGDYVPLMLLSLLPVIVLLLLVLFSYKKPFTCMVILTIIFFFGIFTGTVDQLNNGIQNYPKLFGFMLGQSLVGWVMIRGTINAKKIRDIQRS